MKSNQANFFEIYKLSADIEKKNVIKDLSLVIPAGETHVIMGPNGSGKSSLAKIIMGHPFFDVTGGNILFEGASILKLSPDQRAKKGIFLALQYPKEIDGVTLETFLRVAYVSIQKSRNCNFTRPSVFKFRKLLEEKMELIGLDKEFAQRSINKNFSGGEKKKVEILQILLLEPKMIILDEIDSGLDIDALKVVSKMINKLRQTGVTIILITHYQRLLEYIRPDRVHVMTQGTIIRSGGLDFLQQIEEEGYRNL